MIHADRDMSRERYQELKAYCLQYPEWKRNVRQALLPGAVSYDTFVHSNNVSDPTVTAVERREAYARKIDTVDACARMAGGDRWYAPIILNVCMGVGYETIRDLYSVLPTNNRTAFFTSNDSPASSTSRFLNR